MKRNLKSGKSKPEWAIMRSNAVALAFALPIMRALGRSLTETRSIHGRNFFINNGVEWHVGGTRLSVNNTLQISTCFARVSHLDTFRLIMVVLKFRF